MLNEYEGNEPATQAMNSADGNHDAHGAAGTVARLTELEIKLAFTEDLVDSLNTIVIRQQQQVDALIREVTWLRSQVPSDADGVGGAQARSLRDELPPHY